MTNLRLRMNIYGDEPLGTTKVIANIYPFDRVAPSELRTRLRGIEVPAGDDFDLWKDIELPSGDYELQVSLPSGELLTNEIEIPSGASDAMEVVLESESPHEWLAVQHFLGNVGQSSRGRGGGPGSVKGQPSSAVTSKLRGRRGPAATGGIVGFADLIWMSSQSSASPPGQLWLDLNHVIVSRMGAIEAGQHIHESLTASSTFAKMPAFQDDGEVRAYRCTIDGPVTQNGRPPSQRNAWDGGGYPRSYVMSINQDATHLVCAPLPWFDLSDGQQEAVFEVLSVAGDADVTSAIRDTELGSILGYLTRNSLTSARKLVDNAGDMLFHKFSNPLGAAAGAYVMLSTENQRSNDHWHYWIKNLYENFEWIPDGAIAYAKLKLDLQKSDEDVETALQAALDGFHRGIPFFAIGVRWLFDVLTAFAEDDAFAHRHDEIKHCLTNVRSVARRTDYQQTFTNINISSSQ